MIVKMVDSNNNPNNYKALKISIGAMLRFVPDNLKPKKIRKNAIKKLPFASEYGFD